MKILTFYELNDTEKNVFKYESPQEKEIKSLLEKNAELKKKLKNYENKIDILEKENEYLHSCVEKLENQIAEINRLYKVKDIVKFGNYEWTVIESNDEKALLLCNTCVIDRKFEKDTFSLSALNWKNCTIRYWLNNNFYASFSFSDKKKILETEHDDVTDNFFLLSREEYKKARENGNALRFFIDADTAVHGDWWLRTSGKGKNNFFVVNNSGVTESFYSLKNGVRPSVYVKNKRI